MLLMADTAVAQTPFGRWALAPYACDGDLFTRLDTPVLVERTAVRWFNADCAIVSSYRVKDVWYYQGRCSAEGKTATIPIMLDLRGDRLLVGWNREPVREMQRCQG
jgi:hypothetical protein